MTWDTSRFVSFDLETHLIEPGILAPPIVCGSLARMEEYDGPGGQSVDAEGELVHPRAAVLDRARALLDSDRIIVGANVAFDFGCLVAADPDFLPLVFKAYGEGRVYDVQIAQALHAIAEGSLGQDPRTGGPTCDPMTGKQSGRYSLAICVDLTLGRVDAKANDEWRLRYAELERVPLDQWPETARQYPVDDAVNTLEVAVAQVRGGGAGPTPGPHRNLDDLPNQAETAFALHLGAMWGLRTDPVRVAALRASTETAHVKFVEKFEALGYFRRDDDGQPKKDLNAIKQAVIRAYGGGEPCPAPGCVGGRVLSPKTGNPIKCPDCSGTGMNPGPAPRTPAGGVCADRDALVESGDLDLAALGDNEPEKILTTYLPKLEDETLGRMLRPNVLVSSFRTSYDGLIQLMPRLGGVRLCFRARDGRLLCSVDFGAGELCTLAQTCYWLFGRSHMMDVINASGDPGALHTAFAATLSGRTAEEMTALVKAKDEDAKMKRTVAKFLNFGLPGGMGAAKFILTARKKNAGTTKLPDGTEVPGIRFCVLLLGADRCGAHRVTEWKGKPTPPICRACVELVDSELRPAWFRQWPEIREYFAWVTARVDGGGEFPCWLTDCVRGGLDFTNGANHSFQYLLAQAAKHALRAVARECYVDDSSPMFGTRPVFFAHDEIIAEVPEEVAHLAGPRMAQVMVKAAREWVPDVCMVAEPALMRWWDKNAEPKYVGAGDARRLVAWDAPAAVAA